jgi:hypothetical protein
MPGGDRINLHAADGIDRRRDVGRLVAIMVSTAAGMRSCAVVMGVVMSVIVMMAVAVSMFRLRQSPSPGLLNVIP